MVRAGKTSIEELLSEERWLRSLARGLVRGADRADEVTQETWLAALKHPPERRSSVRGWLASVARNAARQLLRAEGRRARRERGAARREAVIDVADAVAGVELRKRVTQEVLALEEPFRDAIVLRFFEGLSPGEIAGALDVPASTVRSRIHRGLATLRERLDRSYPGGRRAWALALLPFAKRPLGLSGGSLIPGAIVMSVKVKLGLAVGLLLLFCAAVWLVAAKHQEVPDVPRAPGVARLEPSATEDAPLVAEAGDGKEGAKGQGSGVVAENGRISGHVRRPDGSPAPGLFVLSSFRGGFRVAHQHCYAVSGEDGRFSFPAVRGAPYTVYVAGGQPGLVTSGARRSLEVRGGDEDLLFEVPEEPSVTLVAVDALTGEPVSVAGAQLWYSIEGKRRFASVPPIGIQLREVPAAPDAAVRAFDRSCSRFTIGLPPAGLVDPGTRVLIRVWTGDSGYEPGALEIPCEDLRGDLGEREVAIRPLPLEGASLRIIARYEDGATFTGAARLVVRRGEIIVLDAPIAVVEGEGFRKGLPLGADEMTVSIEDKSARISPCPTYEGEARQIEFILPRRWELVLDPKFEGEPRRLSIRIAAGSRQHLAQSRGSASWPYVLHGEESETRTVTFADEEGVIATETVNLVPGKRSVLRPRIPARPPAPVESPAAPRREPLETPVAGGPGVLVGRIVVEGGSIPPPFPLEAARFAEPGDTDDTPNWFETMTAVDGTFRIEGLPPGRYGIWIRPPGLPVKYERFSIDRGEETPPLEIVYEAGATLVVAVRGADGEALRGEEIGITPQGSGFGTNRAGLHTAKTDEQGRATFRRVQPGSWEVTWMPSGAERQVRSTKVVEGEIATVTFDLATAGTLAGRLLDPDGAALAGAIVRLSAPNGERAQTRTDDIGRFRFEAVAVGEYAVSTQALGPRWFSAPAGRVRVVAGENPALEIRLPDTRITGRVTRADTGEALMRDQVQLSASRVLDGEYQHAMTWLDKDGGFEFVGLPPGKWTIQAVPFFLPLQWVEKEVEVPEAGRLEGLAIALPKKGE